MCVQHLVIREIDAIDEHAGLCQNLGPGEFRRRLLADVAERFEPTMRAGAARMDDPLGMRSRSK